MRTIKQCNAAISQIKITGKGFDEAVQSVALDILQHVQQNREVSLAIKLLAALPKSSRGKALADWFQRFGMIEVNLDKATAKEFPLVFNKEGKTDLEGAVKMPWFKCKKDAPLAVEFDFAGKLSALLKHAAQAQKDGLTVKGAELLAKIQWEGVQ